MSKAKLQKLELKEARLQSLFAVVKGIHDSIGPCIVDMSKRGEFLAKATTLDITYQSFEKELYEVQDLKVSVVNDYKPSFEQLEEFMNLYGQIKFYEKKFSQTPDTDTSLAQPQVAQPKLPPLELPSFNGNFNEWPTFYETFLSLIHNNKSLSPEQKVQYLVSKLKDSALNVCAGIPAVAANYDTIWTSLLQRYQDPRSMAANYMDVILNFKPIKVESKDLYNKFIDEVGSSVLALKALNIDNLSEYILYSLAIKKLEVNLCKKFETKVLASQEMPKFTDLLNFVKDEVRIIERIDGHSNDEPKRVLRDVHKKTHFNNDFSFKPKFSKPPVTFISSEYKQDSCISCKKEAHQLYLCPDFNSMKSTDRFEFVKTNNLCFNCFSPKHPVLSCHNKGSCKKCNHRHHTLLHLDSYRNATASNDIPPASDNISPTEQPSVSCCSSQVQVQKKSTVHSSTTVLLSTVKVHILDQYGLPQPVRMLLDSASMSHFITTSCCSKLGIKYKSASLEVGGIGGIESKCKGTTAFTFSSRFDSQRTFNVSEALVVDRITNKLPICPVDISQLSSLKDLCLSDDTFHLPEKIDGLIGAELFSSIIGKPKTLGDTNPIVIESVLGDIVMGRVPTISSTNIPLQNVCAFVQAPLEFIVQKFWTLEEVPSTPQTSIEDKECEELFKKTYKREENGSYSVSILFKSDPNLLGDSFSIAKKRFLNLERKLDSNPELKAEYTKAIDEYKANYASKVDIDKISSPCYFMPHHAVLRPDKATSKVRVVFDSSCTTTSGLSLNDVLYTGPTLYNDLFKLLISFRMFPYACTGDIRKMFLQVHVRKEDQKFQMFLWRNSSHEDIECYQMNRVVFGSKPSPYLAQRCLRQLASDERQNYPEGAEEIETKFYCDDYLNSHLDRNTAVRTLAQCVELLSRGGFELTKIATNSSMKMVNENNVNNTGNVQWDDQTYMKVLGIEWSPTEDNFLFTVKVQETLCTKRDILSTVAKIFDVLGLINPVIVYTKLILKELWKLKIDWDEKVPDSICQKWTNVVQEFSLLSQYKIPRHLSIFQNSKVNLVAFCDASERAYGTCIYVHVVQEDGEFSSHLLCAKSKISPVKFVTIARLELCAAYLLAKLMFAVLPMFKERFEINQVFCFSDSKVALSWITSESSRWKTFVANRVSKIQECVPRERWFHVKGTENPADCLSRGMTPSELVKHSLWANGPSWLLTATSDWPIYHTVEINESALEEEKPSTYVTTSNSIPEIQGSILLDLALRSSSWMKLLRTICYVLKFSGLLPISKINSQDLEFAEITLLKAVQHQAFPNDLKNLERNKKCSEPLQRIHAYLQDGVIRCGGRISNASHLTYSQVHPIVLPKNHHVVNLIIVYYHHKNFHTGPHLLISVLRNKYWILSCRDIVRRQLHKCNTCFRHSPKVLYPTMADLPAARVSECKAFLNTGVDYAGPFQITISRRRGVKKQKAYLCLFVCLSTKALHLELASDLSTPTFMAALRRFVARRGAVKTITCDQGTNFIGASNCLDELYSFLSSEEFNDAYSKELLEQRINFKFNPPASPHFGGIWEANVRCVKVHLAKAIGEQILSYEELNTLLVEVEAIMNSRPLCQMSSDARDPMVLTPAHFLSQHPVKHLPISDDPRINSSLGDRYKLLNQLLSSFWKRWSSEYLTSLQERSKWNQKNTSELKVDLLVLIKSENTPVMSWPMGRVVEVFPGKDGVARVALVQTKSGLFKRPAVKLCPLPSQ